MGRLQKTASQPPQWLLVSILHSLSSLLYSEPLTCTAPSAAPTSVSVSEVTSSSITVQWGAVDCIHRNGDITGYSVRYGVQGSGNTQNMSVSGGSVTEATVQNLMFFTTYSIEVAAVNSAGAGAYSDIVTNMTQLSKSWMVECTTYFWT